MSVLLTPSDLVNCDDPENVSITNGEWSAILSVGKAFEMTLPDFSSHDSMAIPPESLRELAARVKQLSDAPSWLEWLADNGGIDSSV